MAGGFTYEGFEWKSKELLLYVPEALLASVPSQQIANSLNSCVSSADKIKLYLSINCSSNYSIKRSTHHGIC